jgi:hypothetical protein
VAVPAHPKIYHILHVDRLASVLEDGYLFCDARMNGRADCGTTIGMGRIKQRRLASLLDCHAGLHLGDCVPFYFCPRSVMLYLLYCANHRDLAYRGGQEPIIHLQADLGVVVDWAENNRSRWAFTLSNAGSGDFESRCDLAQLDQINWAAVSNPDFRDPAVKEGKQAEFLVEGQFPWGLVERIGVHSRAVAQKVANMLGTRTPRPPIEIKPEWYY